MSRRPSGTCPETGFSELIRSKVGGGRSTSFVTASYRHLHRLCDVRRTSIRAVLYGCWRGQRILLWFLLLLDGAFNSFGVGEHRLWDLCSNRVPINRRSEWMFRL